jgi:hypothetical protein
MLNNLVMVQLLKSKQTLIFLSANLIYRWLSSEFAEKRTYCSLKRAWIGFKIAKQKGNHDKMKYYAEGVQKFQRQLGLTVSSFSDILNEEKGSDLDSPKLNEAGDAAVNEL